MVSGEMSIPGDGGRGSDAACFEDASFISEAGVGITQRVGSSAVQSIGERSQRAFCLDAGFYHGTATCQCSSNVSSANSLFTKLFAIKRILYNTYLTSRDNPSRSKQFEHCLIVSDQKVRHSYCGIGASNRRTERDESSEITLHAPESTPK